MTWFVQTIITAITAFAATNIDDIVVLMVFFAQVNAVFRPRHIIAGQYLGFMALVIVSLVGFVGGMVLPKEWIGCLGIVPIVIGIKQFSDRETDEPIQTVTDGRNRINTPPKTRSWLTDLLVPQTYQVAAITFANGGDNIGIYVPLFASSNGAQLSLLLSIFFLLISVWCGIAYQLTRHPALACVLTRYGHAIVPFVLIGLGIFILLDNGTYQLLFKV